MQPRLLQSTKLVLTDEVEDHELAAKRLQDHFTATGADRG